jgi:hypothetical protein
MSKLTDVIMPDGEPFDDTDWRVYSNEYVKKPVKIRAVKLECPVMIKTLEGVMVGNTGDYLIEGLEGEFYPCKPEIFLKTYEKVKR